MQVRQVIFFAGLVLMTSLAPAQNKPDLQADVKQLNSLRNSMDFIAQEMLRLEKEIDLDSKKHFTSKEHDLVEQLLFRYTVTREAHWRLIDRYRKYRTLFKGRQDQARGFLIGYAAALQLANYSSKFILHYLGQDKVIAKLNEAFPRSEIARDTFDRVFKSVTSIDHLVAINAAGELFNKELGRRDSIIHKVAAEDRKFGRLVIHISDLRVLVDKQVRTILEKKSLLLPRVRNRLRHLAITQFAQATGKKFDDNLYAIQSLVFKNVSRIKSPTAHLIQFSDAQIALILQTLQPGDVILTFTAGYASNVFLPGRFKHGITFVGLPAARKTLGVGARNLQRYPENIRRAIAKNVQIGRENGRTTDCIEAVAEGVIFGSLAYIMKHHINRMIVWRPRLDQQRRLDQLNTVFSLLGNGYDFDFDFGDGSMQCCTEVIYRSLHARNDINFTLTRRAGSATLSADDIVSYCLNKGNTKFDFVLMVVENPHRRRKASILRGNYGLKHLRTLME